MSVRPIDIKTSLMVTDDASRLREAQKAHEAGQAELVAQNKHAHDKKTDTVQGNTALEGAVIRQEDEESNRIKNQQQQSKSKQSDKEKDKNKEKEEEEEAKRQIIPDGTRGLKIDLKA